jgi:hypothetical protein
MASTVARCPRNILNSAGILIAVMVPKTSVDSVKASTITAKKSMSWNTWPK